MKRLLSWSGGKDAAFALHVLEGRVDGLLVTYDESTRAIPMHNVALSHVEAQAEALDLPLLPIPLPPRCPNDVYVARLRDALIGVHEVVFGDLFLADIRAWREAVLRDLGVGTLFPLWGRDTRAVARDVIGCGIRADVCAVDEQRLSPTFVGRRYDATFLAALPDGLDPCGENGEFHTFVWDSPEFRSPIAAPASGG